MLFLLRQESFSMGEEATDFPLGVLKVIFLFHKLERKPRVSSALWIQGWSSPLSPLIPALICAHESSRDPFNPEISRCSELTASTCLSTAELGESPGWKQITGFQEQRNWGTPEWKDWGSLEGEGQGVRKTVAFWKGGEDGVKHRVLIRVSFAQSCPTLCDPMDYIVSQAPLSMEFSRQVELPFPSPGDLLDPGIEPASPTLQADSLLDSSLLEAGDEQTAHTESLVLTPGQRKILAGFAILEQAGSREGEMAVYGILTFPWSSFLLSLLFSLV